MVEESVAIVGYGHVGKLCHQILPQAVIYDKYLDGGVGNEESLAECDILFICVSAPTNPDGSVGIHEIESALQYGREDSLYVIKSTIPPGTTAKLLMSTGRRIVYFPEFIGEWTYPVDVNLTTRGWPIVIIGGETADAHAVVNLLAPRLGASRRFEIAAAIDAELAKYMENSWLAMQVVFANEFYDVARAVGADYWRSRELFLSDPRIPRTHTVVDVNSRGFGGNCLPKDLNALLHVIRRAGLDVPLLEGVRESNRRWRDV